MFLEDFALGKDKIMLLSLIEGSVYDTRRLGAFGGNLPAFFSRCFYS